MKTDAKEWFLRRIKSNTVGGCVPINTTIKLAGELIDIVKKDVRDNAIQSVKATICDRLCSFRSTPCTEDCGMIQAFIKDLNERVNEENESIIIGNYEILLNDYKGKAPKGDSWEVDGKWYYDYEAAISIKFPNEFHLPTRKEWIDICNLRNNKSSNLQDKLKLNLNGYYDNELVHDASSNGHYWSSTCYGSYRAYVLYFICDYISAQNFMEKCYGCTVRGIKLINK